MTADVKIYLDGTLAFSSQPGAPNPAVTVKCRKHPKAPAYLGFALVELQSVTGSFFADVTVDQGDGVLSLYGQLDDIPLGPEQRRPVGIAVRLQATAERPAPLRFITLAFHDGAGTSLGTLRFQFTCRALAEEALFQLKQGQLPELDCEPGRARSQSFQVETLQPAANTVSYALNALGTPSPGFAHSLQQTANRYGSPDGPLVDADYFGTLVPAGSGEVFRLDGQDAQGASQSIPFISWVVDTPARGELRIAGLDPDPAGRDRNAESITLQNVSSRVLNLAGCYIEDEQRMSVLGVPLSLPLGTPVRQMLQRSRLRPGDRLVVKPGFTMNNDFDAFLLRNRRGRALDFAGYVRRLPGQPAPAQPRQRVVARQSVMLDGRVETADVNLPSPLEDGDTIIIRPDPASRLWSGEIPHPATGPEGWLDASGQPVPAPSGWALPQPAAPLYALLLDATPEPRLIGNTAHSIVIDRQSKARDGLGAGAAVISFRRNDPSFNRAFTWGAFVIEVVVLRH